MRVTVGAVKVRPGEIACHGQDQENGGAYEQNAGTRFSGLHGNNDLSVIAVARSGRTVKSVIKGGARASCDCPRISLIFN